MSGLAPKKMLGLVCVLPKAQAAVQAQAVDRVLYKPNDELKLNGTEPTLDETIVIKVLSVRLVHALR